jgi:Fur family transcriptional regulator, ferric uptake regulator
MGTSPHRRMTGILGDPMAIDLERSIVQRLDAVDLRFTAVRRAIVDGLRGAGGPVTLPELLAQVPGLAQSSAYRNLSLMESAGVVRRLLHGDGHARYELAEALTEHHHHLICESCGAVRDVRLDARLERTLDKRFDEVAAAEGFTVVRHAIDVYGTCADCAT